MMRVFIASDHAGLQLKYELLRYMKAMEYTIEDLGTHSEDSVDYPDYANSLAQRMIKQGDGVGILICGSGIGMSIAANRYPKIRAALCCNADLARLAREHNDANVLVLGARFINANEAINIVKVFMETDFAEGRHQVRVDKL